MHFFLEISLCKILVMAEAQLQLVFDVDEKDHGFWTETVDYVRSKYPRFMYRPRATVFKIIELLMFFFLAKTDDLPLAIAGDLIFFIIILHTSLAKYELSITYNYDPVDFETNEKILYIVQAFANAQSMPISNLESAQMTQETCNYLLKFLADKTGKSAKRIVMERRRQLTENSDNSSMETSSENLSTESSDTTITSSESDGTDA